MSYTLTIHKKASKKLLSMDVKQRHRVAQAIYKLGDSPDSLELDTKLMQGSTANLWRMRVGDWRVIYERDDMLKIVAIEKIGSRGDIYK
jgi:mRNA interferase RelE/StbE